MSASGMHGTGFSGLNPLFAINVLQNASFQPPTGYNKVACLGFLVRDLNVPLREWSS
jgi:hypothetical protein